MNTEKDKNYREVRHPSVAPYYVIALSWIIFAMLCPMYKIGHFIVIILSRGIRHTEKAHSGEGRADTPAV